MRKTKYTLEEKFWRGVDKKSPEDCWNWIRSLTVHGGYGQFTHRGKLYKAHQVSFRIHKGDIPKGFFICHTCNNPACCNPNHLYAGTPQENWDDCKKSGRAFKFPIKRGRECHQTKLTEEQVRYILQADERGCVLAKKFQVSRSTISKIRRKKIWKHVQN